MSRGPIIDEPRRYPEITQRLRDENAQLRDEILRLKLNNALLWRTNTDLHMDNEGLVREMTHGLQLTYRLPGPGWRRG